MTRPYAEVIGDPIAHSKSPLIHNFWLKKLGIDAEYRKTHVRADELKDFLLARNRDENWHGCNVTIPHKTTILPLLDRLDPLAERIGAANTVVMRDCYLEGFNTDAAGFIDPLLTHLDDQICHRFAYLIGSGGAALAAANALDEAGFTIVAYNRDPPSALKKLKRFLWDEDLNLDLAYLADAPTGAGLQGETDCCRVWVNATSLGMVGQPSLTIHPEFLEPNQIVFDMVYAPLETPLLAAARARGLRTIDGLQMLVGQAAAAFELFFGQPAPREHDAELRALLTA